MAEQKPMTVADVRAMLRGQKVPAAQPPAAPMPATDVEKQLEAETGKDVVQTGKAPPTFVETDKPAPAVPKQESPKPKAKE